MNVDRMILSREAGRDLKGSQQAPNGKLAVN